MISGAGMDKKFKLDFDALKRSRIAILMGLSPYTPEDWPFDVIDGLIAGEQEHGFEWLMTEIDKISHG
jgi:hypothetical protein